MEPGAAVSMPVTASFVGMDKPEASLTKHQRWDNFDGHRNRFSGGCIGGE
jgi:hypothetical protein